MAEFRTYVFTNMYFEGIRAGVQGAHAVARLVATYPDFANRVLSEDETMIFLQWGEHEDLVSLSVQLSEREIAHASFQEPGVRHAVTAVAAFIPMSMFDTSDFDVVMDSDPLALEMKSKRLTA